MTTTKIPLSEILKNENYAIRITSAEQAKELVPGYNKQEDLELFFQHHKHHSEFVGATHGPSGSGFYFLNPTDKTILDFEDVEFDM